MKADISISNELVILNHFMQLTQQEIISDLALCASQILGSFINKITNGNEFHNL